MRRFDLLLICVCASFAACGDDGSGGSDTADATTTDTSAAETSAETTDDTAVAETSGDTTASETADDTTVAETNEEVAGGDTSSAEDVPDATGCEYFEEPRVAECNGLLTQFLKWSDFGASGCPDYYTAGDDRYESFAALAAAKSCDAECEYVATIGADFIGCVSGSRTGYEQYEASGQGCLEAVYNTPVGLLRDLCDWQEQACYAGCNPSCQEGIAGTVDASQLAASGTVNVTTRQSASQELVVSAAGYLAGIELSAKHCGTPVGLFVTIMDIDGNEVAWADVAPETIPAGCTTETPLVTGPRAAVYADLATNCLAVAAGDTLRFVVTPAFDTPEGLCGANNTCEEGDIGKTCAAHDECELRTTLGIATGDPYVGEGPFTGADLTFKVFIE